LRNTGKLYGIDLVGNEVLSNIAEGLGLNQDEMVKKLEDGTYDNVLNNL
jgi:uncharacterized protein YidB (DUF937 family)